MGSLDLVVFIVLAERGFCRSPLLESALTEVCSEIPGAMASSLIGINTFLVKTRGQPSPPNQGLSHLLYPTSGTGGTVVEDSRTYHPQPTHTPHSFYFWRGRK